MGGVEVAEDGVAADELVVDDHWEMDVQDDVVVDGQPQQQADQPVLLFGFKGHRIEPVKLGVLVIGEHTLMGREGGGEGGRGGGGGGGRLDMCLKESGMINRVNRACERE